MQIDQSKVEQALRGYTLPHLGLNVMEANCITALTISQGHIAITVTLGFAVQGIAASIQNGIESVLLNIEGITTVDVMVESAIAAAPVQGELETLAGVKNIIAVASGKGGVGKSTTAANLALALAAEGAKVGILDADIYGPSMGQMFGIADGTRPEVKNDQFFMPLESHGIQIMSMAFLVTEDTPVVWRGPMVSGALIQLLTQTVWNDLDYLVIDLPPGTGDIQLTLAQKIPVSGSVIVTTPQDLALIDAKKGIEMFHKVGVPVLGVVENMAVHICSQCGHAEHVFGAGGGEKMAQQYDVDLLGSLPLQLSIREQADSGRPTVAAEPESAVALSYRDIARTVAAELWQLQQQGSTVPTISIEED